MKLLLSIYLASMIHGAAVRYQPTLLNQSTYFKHNLLSQGVGLLIGYSWTNQAIEIPHVFLLMINLYVFYTDYYYRLIPIRVHFLYLFFLKINYVHIVFLLIFLFVLSIFSYKEKIGLGDVLLMGSSGLMMDTISFNWVLLVACFLGILFYWMNKNTQELPFGSFWVLALSLLMNY